MTDRCSKLRKAVPTSRTTAAYMVLMVMDHGAILQRRNDFVLMDNRTELITMIYESLRAL